MLSVLWWIMSIRIIINNQNFCLKTFCTVDKKKSRNINQNDFWHEDLKLVAPIDPLPSSLPFLESMAWVQALSVIGSEDLRTGRFK